MTNVEKAQAALDAALDNLLALELAGPQAWVDYSVDGESYQYTAAKRQLQESITTYQKLLQQLGGPFHNRSRATV